MRTNKGRLFVISAPSGTGKTSMCQALMKIHPEIGFSVSCTTRKPRPGEVDGVHYSFVTEAEFKNMRESGRFLEWASVHGAYYGTSRDRVMKELEGGRSILLDIDVQGARQIRESFEGAVFVFVLPPSIDALIQRLHDRKGNSEEEIRARVRKSADEMREYLWYDYVIINDKLDEALAELDSVVRASALRPEGIDPYWVRNSLLLQTEG